MTEQKFQLVFFLLQYFIQAFSVFRWWDRICPLLKRLVSPHKWISGFVENLFSSDLFFHFDVSTLHSKTHTCSPLEPRDREGWNLGFCSRASLTVRITFSWGTKKKRDWERSWFCPIWSEPKWERQRREFEEIWQAFPPSVPPVVPISEFWSRSPFEFRRRGNWTKEASVSVSQEVRRQERHGRTQEVSQEVSCPLLPVYWVATAHQCHLFSSFCLVALSRDLWPLNILTEWWEDMMTWPATRQRQIQWKLLTSS